MSGAARPGDGGHQSARRRRCGRRWLWLIPVWTVPLGFLLAGYWPFGLLAAVALSAWVLLGIEGGCPNRGARRP